MCMGFGRWMHALDFPASAASRTMFGSFSMHIDVHQAFVLLLKACWAQPSPRLALRSGLARCSCQVFRAYSALLLRSACAALGALTRKCAHRLEGCRLKCLQYYAGSR